MHEHLKAYIDGELAPQQVKAVEQALKENPALRQELDQLRRISSTLREASVVPAPAGLDKTLNALSKTRPVARNPFLRFAPAGGLVFACVLALVVFSHYNSRQPFYDDNAPMPVDKNPGPAAAETSAPSATPLMQSNSPANGISAKAPGGGKMEDANKVNGFVAPAPKPATQSPTAGEAMQPPRQVIKTGDLHLSVPKAKDTVDAISKLTKRLGGLVESSNVTGDDAQGVTAQISIRVPVAHFDEAISDLQALGKSSDVSTSGKDVTSTVVSNEAKLETMHSQEIAYQKILQGAKKVDDVLEVKDRLDNVQQEIASLEAEQKTLKSEAAMSTITVAVSQPPAKKKVVAAGPVADNWLNSTWSGAWAQLAFAGRQLTTALIYLVVFSPVWIPFVVFANLLTRHVRRLA